MDDLILKNQVIIMKALVDMMQFKGMSYTYFKELNEQIEFTEAVLKSPVI